MRLTMSEYADSASEDTETGFDNEESRGSEEDSADTEKKEKEYSEGTVSTGIFSVHQRLKHNPNASMDEIMEIMERYHSGDDEKKKSAQLDMLAVLSSFALKQITTKYSSFYKEWEDLICEAYIGIYEGMKSYDPRKGAPTTFFAPYIHRAVQDYINTNITHSTAYYNSESKEILECIRRKEENEIPWTELDIHVETGKSIKTIRTVLSLRNSTTTTLDKVENMVSSTNSTPEELYVQKEAVDELYSMIGGNLLREKEKACLLLRYGVADVEAKSIGEIADITGLTRQQVTANISSAKRKIRNAYYKKEMSHKFSLVKRSMRSTMMGEILGKQEMDEDQECYLEYISTSI